MIKRLLSNKELIWTASAQVIQLFSGVLIIKLLTSYLSYNEYGQFSLVMAVSAFVLTLPFTAIQQGFYRYRSVYCKKNQAETFYAAMFFGTTGLILAYTIFAKLIVSTFWSYTFWDKSFLVIAFLIISEIYKIFTRSIVNADRRRRNYALSIIVEFSIKLLVYIVFITIPEENVLNIVLYIYISANLVSFLICFYPYMLQMKYINKNILIDVWKKALVFSSPLLLWAIFGWLRDSSLRWFIEIHLGTKEVAIFTAISSIAIVIPMAIQSVTSAYIIPILYQNDQGQEKKRVRRVFDKLMYMLYFLGGVIFLFLYLFSEYAVLLITDEKYIAYSWALPWMFVSYYLFCCGMLKASVLLVEFKPQKLLLPNLCSGIITLLGGFLFISQFGMRAVFSIYVLSFISYFVLASLLVKRNV